MRKNTPQPARETLNGGRRPKRTSLEKPNLWSTPEVTECRLQPITWPDSVRLCPSCLELREAVRKIYLSDAAARRCHGTQDSSSKVCSYSHRLIVFYRRTPCLVLRWQISRNWSCEEGWRVRPLLSIDSVAPRNDAEQINGRNFFYRNQPAWYSLDSIFRST